MPVIIKNNIDAMKLHKLTFILLVVAGLNLLATGLFNWEIADLFGGQSDTVSRAVYVILGLAAVAEIVLHKKMCRDCAPDSGSVV